jgi:cytochrome c oxidase subunit 2
MLVPPVSSDAKAIDDLFTIVYIFAFAVFFLVEGLIVYSAIRFRRRRADEAPVQVHGNRAAELGWTVIPAIIVGLLFVFAVNTLGSMTARGASGLLSHVHPVNDQNALRRIAEAQKVDLVIDVTARQWVWQFKYPGGELAVNEQLIVPANRNIRLDIVTADVIHAWWMPAFGGMLYINPGEMSHIWFNVPPGEYTGQCNVFCGVAHAQMIARVKALPPEEYDRWHAEQLAQLSGPAGAGDAARGQDIFLNKSICWSCHSIDGTKAQGKVAPRPLTRFATYEQIAQAVPNTPDNLSQWLRDPQSVKPGTQMPNLNLKPQEIADLAAFLGSLK